MRALPPPGAGVYTPSPILSPLSAQPCVGTREISLEIDRYGRQVVCGSARQDTVSGAQSSIAPLPPFFRITSVPSERAWCGVVAHHVLLPPIAPGDNDHST